MFFMESMSLLTVPSFHDASPGSMSGRIACDDNQALEHRGMSVVPSRPCCKRLREDATQLPEQQDDPSQHTLNLDPTPMTDDYANISIDP